MIGHAGIPKSRLEFTSPEEALNINQRGEGKTGWFVVAYNEPGKGFALTVDDNVFQIRAGDILLGNLVYLADKLFSPITEAWCSDALALPVKLAERAHTVEYSFNTIFRLGNHKVQRRPVPNYEVLTEALSLNRGATGHGTRSVGDSFPSLAVERYVRLDFTQHALKSIDGGLFNTGIILAAPFNEGNSILDISAFLKMEEEFGFDLSAGLDWGTALVSFYRDIFMKRFLDNFLCSTETTYK
jgi:hypothetical protein